MEPSWHEKIQQRANMNETDFLKLVKERQAKCYALLVKKSGEYSRNNDKLHNFKMAARMEGKSPEEALRGMWMKHLVSIMDIIDDIEIRGGWPDAFVLAEKLDDNHNYLHLLEALIVERMSNERT